ncbi:MAG: L-2-amino-thiazoline-4-carboxylic acid hydrolase [Deltaproteobacteria bacterium]|nr:L-2-amino-thiazoline-4-carboxylic acid hydrolase [Deltaproteobacteria bacterium]
MKVPKPDHLPPLEVQREKLIGGLASERINLYRDLKKILGEEKGEAVYRDLYYETIKRVRKNFPGGKLPIGELMKRELATFPVMGFELEIDHEVEDGEDVYYEHLTKCPFFDMAKKMGIDENVCDFICRYDVEFATQDKRGRWEVVSRLGDGADECQFRIREWGEE